MFCLKCPEIGPGSHFTTSTWTICTLSAILPIFQKLASNDGLWNAQCPISDKYIFYDKLLVVVGIFRMTSNILALRCGSSTRVESQSESVSVKFCVCTKKEASNLGSCHDFKMGSDSIYYYEPLWSCVDSRISFRLRFWWAVQNLKMTIQVLQQLKKHQLRKLCFHEQKFTSFSDVFQIQDVSYSQYSQVEFDLKITITFI